MISYTKVSEERKVSINGFARPQKYTYRKRKSVKSLAVKGFTLFTSDKSYYVYFTASFNSFPGLKAGTFEAAICISSPV